MNYPTLQEVDAASRFQLCEWWRFLKSPMTDEEIVVMDKIADRFHAIGGFTPAISKAIGWEKQ